MGIKNYSKFPRTSDKIRIFDSAYQFLCAHLNDI